MSSVCVLLPTYSSGVRASEFTIGLIERFWPEHPPLFRIGTRARGGIDLPFDGDESSWIEVVQSGCRQVLERGFTAVYLVLDDHPPVGPCHSLHLGETLPGLLQSLNAVQITLVGWDGRTWAASQPLPREARGLRRLGPGFQFHFQLHPALWKTEALLALCDRFRTLSYRNAWEFEHAARRHFGELPEAWRNGVYRIQGHAMAVHAKGGLSLKTMLWRGIDRAIKNLQPVELLTPPKKGHSGLFRRSLSSGAQLVARRCLDMDPEAFRRLGKIERLQRVAARLFSLSEQEAATIGSAEFKRELRRRIGFDRCVYEGPYPIFRNGFLIRGKLNPFFAEYLESSGGRELAESVRGITGP